MPRKTPITGQLSLSQKSMFPAGTNFWGENGRVKAPFSDMLIGTKQQSGPHAQRGQFKDWYADKRRMPMPDSYDGKYAGKHTGRKGKWTRGNWRATKGGSANIIHLKNISELYLQTAMAAHLLPISAENWKQVLAHRALKVFQESFQLKRFNSAGSQHWKVNTPWTRQKRKWKGTWPGANRLMQETNALYKSLHIVNGNKVVTGVSYAGVHNDPKSFSPPLTYGNGFGGKFSPPKPVTQRQFMGHSTLIDEFMAQYEKNYLFDTIFRKPA